MKTIQELIPCMTSVEIVSMPNVIILGKAYRQSQLPDGPGPIWGKLYADGSLAKMNALPRIVAGMVGWTGDAPPLAEGELSDYTYMIGVMTPYGTPIPEGFDYRVLRGTLVAKGLLGEDVYETIRRVRELGYEPHYGDNNGWNAELYLDGEPEEDKWSWLVPVVKRDNGMV